jgi:hypothetical protein
MQRLSPDDADYQFLTAPAATVQVRLAADPPAGLELQIFGNRAGLLSLANVLLWLVANAWRREFLALSELPFVQSEAALSIRIRLTADEASGRDGLLTRSDAGEQLEWLISEDDLRRVALGMHSLACRPSHEYDRLEMAEGSAAIIHVRMIDAAAWLQQGHT